MYSYKEVTGVEKVDNWLEIEGHYIYDLGGGTAGIGVFAAPGMDKTENGGQKFLHIQISMLTSGHLTILTMEIPGIQPELVFMQVNL